MQETPNFESQRLKFIDLNRQAILDGREQIIGADRSYLESVFHRLELYFGDANFRYTLPLSLRQGVEPYFENILSYLQTIYSWQQDSTTPINGANVQSQIQNIFGQMQAVDQQLGGSYFSYFSSEAPLNDFLQQVRTRTEDLNNRFQDVVNEIERRNAELEAKRSEFESTAINLQSSLQIKIDEKEKKIDNMDKKADELLRNAQLLVGLGSGNKLADYYQRLANGRTIKSNFEYIERERKSWAWITKTVAGYILGGILLAAVIVYLVIIYVHYHPVSMDVWVTYALLIFGIALSIMFVGFSSRTITQLFNKHFPGGHARTASLWAGGAIVITLLIAVYSAFMIHEMKLNGTLNWEFFVPKLLILLAPAYLVRLCVQNYRANAHLAVQYTHRATIMSIAGNYSETTALNYETDPEQKLAQVAAQAKMDILLEAAKVMFAQSESGFITQKEGAGSGSDNMIDSVNVGRFIK